MARPAPSLPPPVPLHVQVLGPDTGEAATAEIRRLLSARPNGRIGRDRLAHATRVVARSGARAVGVAAYERAGNELRVLELAVDPPPPLCAHHVIGQLLAALEMAALAGGCGRLVLLPAAVLGAAALEPLGYRLVTTGGSGGWLEKTFHT
jgi:hypothetical protein